MADESLSEQKLKPHVPHTARIWNYWLGGKDHFPVDREVGDRVKEIFPVVVELARADRLFLGRAVRFLTAEAGIRQFLDIGTGLPTQDNTHEVAQQIAPESRVVYVDNDPLVLVHARALLTSSEEGATSYIDADARDPSLILREAAKTLDFTQPVAIMLLGIMHFVNDDDELQRIIDELMAAVPSGSYVAVANTTTAVNGEATAEAVRVWNIDAQPKLKLRTPERIAQFFTGYDMVEPGWVSCSRWRPEPEWDGSLPVEVDQWCGVVRKP
ncbi:SAM-dependent methyltransferase [Nonomuraea sp. KC401]|uniref:SAM-dependent methyltransferase n=1 Tax=unclassified Nonomuraea TaxID=2593643 RepID=UPI0010FD9DC2|nr:MULTISPECIES: SAM-dependent methyltransferase [unclassified Nonomuraea]NBE98445.1 SAM-dependent methyltransferase [Nonomuraea sp. K271]TLF60998.1 SAM-dependent methyltransferase [Nonomuraea sp. KC401]